MRDSCLEKNKNHFDTIYSRTDVSKILRTVRGYEHFLDRAIRTDISWAGIYKDDFRKRLGGARVLDLGAGTGLNALIMAALGATVYAIDVAAASPRIIDSASRELGFSKRVKSVEGDFLKIHFPADSFDLVVGKAFLHHLSHELEDRYLRKIAKILCENGEARFFEPAVNSKLLDDIRWLIPVPGRPSKLRRKDFAAWKASDVHPQRNNSSSHFEQIGRKYFSEVTIIPMGGFTRIHRILPSRWSGATMKRLTLSFDRLLPRKVRSVIARSQSIIYSRPKKLCYRDALT